MYPKRRPFGYLVTNDTMSGDVVRAFRKYDDAWAFAVNQRGCGYTIISLYADEQPEIILTVKQAEATP